MNPAKMVWLGFAIMFVGFLVVALGAITGAGGSGSSGWFILIGPIPIVFGSGPNSGMLATVALVIALAMVGVYLVSLLAWRSGRGRGSRKRTSG